MTKPPLAFDDAFELLGPALGRDAVVLVGGQAVNYWLSYYGHREPSLRQLALVTSDDVDFCGTQDDALRMARAIVGSSVQLVDVEARSAATAIVTFEDKQGVQRQIDSSCLLKLRGPERVRFNASVCHERTEVLNFCCSTRV